MELEELRRFSFVGNPILPSTEQKQLAANVQMSINVRERARQGDFRLIVFVELKRKVFNCYATDARHIALAAEKFSKQADERLKLQEALRCEQKRLENLRAAQTLSAMDGDSEDAVGSDSGEEVTFSRRGRSKLLNIEGQFSHCK
jgi:hypothetical protein